MRRWIGGLWPAVGRLAARAGARRRMAAAPAGLDRILLDNVNDAVIAIAADFRILIWNRAAEQIYGWSAAEVLGKSLLDVIPVVRYPRGQLRDDIHAAISREGGWAGQVVQQHRDGHELIIDGSARLIPAGPGRPDVIVAINRDITERKRRAEERRRSEARNRALLAAVPDMIFRISADGEYLDFETNDGDGLYVSPAEIIGKNVRETLPADAATTSLDAIARTLATGQLQVAEYGLPMPSGRRLFEARMAASGPGEVLTIVRDITDRKRAEEVLRQSEERLRILFEHSPDAIFLMDPHQRAGAWIIVECNDAACRMNGYAREELVGQDIHMLSSAPFDLDSRRRYLERLRQADTIHAETVHRRKDGRLVPIEFSTSLVRLDGRELVLGIDRDITERKRTQQALRLSEERFRQLADNVREIFWIADARTMRRLYVSPAYEKIMGRSSESLLVDVESLLEAIHPEDRERVRAAQARQIEGTYDEEYRIVRPDGEIRWIWSRAFPIRNQAGEIYRVAGLAEDITARKEAEQERLLLERRLLETQRLESLGVLAGGIAHDFNNLMAVIIGNASLALMSLPQDSPARAALETIKATAQQGSELPRQMLTYTGKSPSVKEQVNLALLVSQMDRLLKASVTKNVELCYELAPDVPAIRADAGQMRQVVMNLASNASEAIGAQPGTITLRIDAVRRDELDRSARYLGVEPAADAYVRLRVVDTGPGLDEATRERIFDPFFTTKFIGRGLGLSAVLGIVRSHDGALAIDSAPGAGTTVSVLLPAVQAGPTVPPTQERTTGKLVLVADDEEAVRLVLEEMLEQLGFDVVAAADGVQAVETVHQRAADLCCILLDATMPRMSGAEALHAIRRAHPGAPVILMSGYGEREIVAPSSGDRPAGFLAKPFTAEQLHAAVLAVVASPS